MSSGKGLLIFCLSILSCLLHSAPGYSAELLTNATYSTDVPKWCTKGRIDKVVDRVQSYLEWSIHRVNLYWYHDQATFQNSHSLGPGIVAVTKNKQNSVHLGPLVNSENFDKIFAHELAHVIIAQKYKQAIPGWLEEGLANYISKAEVVDYKLLTTEPFPDDVHNLIHPASGTTAQVHYKYMASQALAEMLAKKCDLKNLLRLSVGMKMDSYIDTYCNIKDLNKAFKDWVHSQAKK